MNFKEFAAKSCNVRLGLYTDGFTPFGNFGQMHSCWQVVATLYNLPPWLYVKKHYMFLTLLIPGPKSLEGKLDVNLQPLIKELKQLWEEGIQTYDVSRKQNFTLKATVMWTISDFLAHDAVWLGGIRKIRLSILHVEDKDI